MNIKEEVHRQVNAWKEAVISQDIESIMHLYHPEVRAFDAIAALQFDGRDSYADHWRRCLEHCKLSSFELADVRIEGEEGLAVCSFLNRCGGIDESGKENACWMRATQVYRQSDGRWQIIHEHFSVPFDAENGQVMWHLTP